MTPDATDRRALAGHAAVLVLAIAVVAGTALGGLALSGGPAADQLFAPSGDRILEDVRERYEAAETVAGTATVTATNGTETRTFEVSFAATDDGESRVSVDGPRGTVVAGSNGSGAWVHFEETGLTRVYTEAELREAAAERETDGEHPLDAALEEVLPANASWDAADLRALAWDWSRENTTAERVGVETVDGTGAYVVAVEPDDEGRAGTLRLWVARDSSKVLKQRLAGPEGTVTVRYTETRFDVSIADSTFAPPTASVPDLGTTARSFDELAAATSLALPRLDAAGYEFAGGSVVAYGGETTVVQQYGGPADVAVVTTTAENVPGVAGDGSAAGRADVSTATVAGTTVTVVETDRGVAVSWTDGDVRHAVVSDQSREAVLELAAAVLGNAGT